MVEAHPGRRPSWQGFSTVRNGPSGEAGTTRAQLVPRSLGGEELTQDKAGKSKGPRVLAAAESSSIFAFLPTLSFCEMKSTFIVAG